MRINLRDKRISYNMDTMGRVEDNIRYGINSDGEHHKLYYFQ